MDSQQKKGIIFALAAASLFGATTPVAKILLLSVHPLLVASLFYLGSGIGLGIWSLSRRERQESSVGAADIPWLVAVLFFGGVLGPILLMFGLERLPASTSSLLLNLEGVGTAFLAWFIFKENFDSRVALGMLCIIAGGVLLSWEGRLEGGSLSGSLLIITACFCWALDNNLTRRISAADPVQIATMKGLVAGIINMCIAFLAGVSLPNTLVVLEAGLVGLLGYGMSIVCFIYSLRFLGSARTGAYFSSAPFIGAALSMILLGEAPRPLFYGAVILMIAGLLLHLSESHEHNHTHDEHEHEHLHEHDSHHQHQHPEGGSDEVHSHSHRHEALTHCHPHFPDLHHRHYH